MIIAVDFDGTICEHKFPEIGDEYRGAIQTLKDLQFAGHQIIIWTCRTQDEYLLPMSRWFTERGFEPDAVNINLTKGFAPHPKIYADVYFDDRSFPSFPGWAEVRSMFRLGQLKI